ncbi:MAG: hypothetical protein ABR908_04960 [Terriglobales bacterium]|jgi:hypothetical protein
MTSVRAASMSFFCGAMSFWLPDVALFLAFDRSASPWVWMTIACPAMALLFYLWILPRREGTVGPSSALYQLLGIWMLGHCFMTVASFLAPGSRAALTFPELIFLVLSTLLPIWTLPLSAMHGSGFGLVLITIALLIFHIWKESHRWLIPPPLAFWRKGRSISN